MHSAVVQTAPSPVTWNTDTGIALANITLAAWASGVGSCIMGAINKPALSELLGTPHRTSWLFMVALYIPPYRQGRTDDGGDRHQVLPR